MIKTVILVIPFLILQHAAANSEVLPRDAFRFSDFADSDPVATYVRCAYEADHVEFVKKRPMDDSCVTGYSETAPPAALKASRNGKFKLIGSGGIVLVSTQDCPRELQAFRGFCRYVISGEDTRLKNVRALDVHERWKLLFAVDSNRRVLGFRLPADGSPAPGVDLRGPDAEGASDLAVSDSRNQAYIANPVTGKILIYGISIDPMGPIGFVKKGDIDLAKEEITADRIALSPDEDSMYLFDRKAFALHRFSRSGDHWYYDTSRSLRAALARETEAIDVDGSGNVRFWSAEGKEIGKIQNP